MTENHDAADGPGSGGRGVWPRKRFTMSRTARVANTVMSGLIRLGMIPHTYLMSVVGRKSGQRHTTPVTLVEDGDRKWLVAPYGPVSWVLNVRAAGTVTLRRGRTESTYSTREVDAAEAGPVLKQYVTTASATRPYFEATKDSPASEFAAEAGQHPVFQLTPAG